MGKVAIIGSGIAGLSAACYAAKAGHEVHVFEKNATIGGRARQFVTDNGYTFDMGPSWYWMPDVIDAFFKDFGKERSSYYELMRLDPQFEIVFDQDHFPFPADYPAIRLLFEHLEPNASTKLDQFMEAAKVKYHVAMDKFIYKPCHHWGEFLSLEILQSAFKLDLLTGFRNYVNKYFKHPYLRSIMEFPVIFLGASPKHIPAMYSLMNYGGYALGTWYPKGGFFQLVLAMESLALELGVVFHLDEEVQSFYFAGNQVQGLRTVKQAYVFDQVIASSDYEHTESLLPSHFRNYSESYWSSRTFAPSCLIYYLGFNKRIDHLHHHTLFFEHEIDTHLATIYEDKKWPDKPLFYVCCPSKSDEQVAPEGHENIFLLMPIACGLDDHEENRETYFQLMLNRLEKHTGERDLAKHIDYKRSYCVRDFQEDYHAYAGNAYGLANTLKQTAVWKPAVRNKKIKNLYYTGQLTVPGPGVPPAIISGKIAAQQLQKL
ncbi:phytoene desaturase family protein [Sphingobacterium sp. HJSM2_6]|uniref:phytoene desaturase family protein n=1 Tax=Sphingobacterium sp. HJSM2_6 TaxID=3366264 RepID=UPI003BC1E3C4